MTGHDRSPTGEGIHTRRAAGAGCLVSGGIIVGDVGGGRSLVRSQDL